MSIQERQAMARYRWNADEFYRMLDLGFFRHLNDRVELVDGTIIQMPPQKNFHSMGIGLCEEALKSAFGSDYWVRVQMSLDLNPYSVVDPDLAIIAGALRTHDPAQNPASALLVVEVSLSTVRYDRRVKGSLYAAAGIEDYWILNLVKRQLEIRRRPGPDVSQKFKHRYRNVSILSANDVAIPLAAPQTRIAVADLFP